MVDPGAGPRPPDPAKIVHVHPLVDPGSQPGSLTIEIPITPSNVSHAHAPRALVARLGEPRALALNNFFTPTPLVDPGV